MEVGVPLGWLSAGASPACAGRPCRVRAGVPRAALAVPALRAPGWPPVRTHCPSARHCAPCLRSRFWKLRSVSCLALRSRQQAIQVEAASSRPGKGRASPRPVLIGRAGPRPAPRSATPRHPLNDAGAVPLRCPPLRAFPPASQGALSAAIRSCACAARHTSSGPHFGRLASCPAPALASPPAGRPGSLHDLGHFRSVVTLRMRNGTSSCRVKFRSLGSERSL
jgi:hypothetical protein